MKPTPQPDDVTEFYWRGAADGTLLVLRRAAFFHTHLMSRVRVAFEDRGDHTVPQLRPSDRAVVTP